MIGNTISHYTILEKIGEGGMGVVYKAQDTKLDRFVALKFLPPHLNSSEQDKARFVQEAKAASALNHPNVCTVYDIQEFKGQIFLVMEFVDGQTLSAKKSIINFKQAVDIGIQIADGLAAAHEKGIVHRDIKPDNIMVRKDGIVQIMDFGLAKLRGNVTRLTKEGSTVGTAGYMSPEQVQGQDADHRSDIFSFGVVLYELFTGQLPFRGVHETALAYEIVNVDPAPMVSMKPDIDPHLDAIVLECLEKEPKERTQSAAQVGLDLKRYRRESSRQRLSRITAAKPVYNNPVSPAAPETERDDDTGRNSRPVSRAVMKKSFLPWIIAMIAFVAMIVFLILYLQKPVDTQPRVSAYILPPDGMTFAQQSAAAGEGQFAISPDGSKIAFMTTDSTGKTHLVVRSLGSLYGTTLAGTEGASYPFWSPDNHWLGFFQGGKLKKIDATGGPAVSIADAEDGRGGTWNQDGTIIFSPAYISPLSKVSAGGGDVQSGITKFDTTRHEQSHRWPHFLPDGNHYLYFARASYGGVERAEDAVYVGSLDGKVNKRLLFVKGNTEYANGYLIFLRENTLMAQTFDAGTLEISGDPFPIAENVEYDLNYNRALFSISRNGILVYQRNTMSSKLRMERVDGTGTVLGTIGEPAEFGNLSFSPDGKFVAADEYDPQSHNRDIWLYELDRMMRTRFTFDPSVDENPVWSPDGGRIVFHSDRKGHYDLYQKMTSGAGVEEVLLESSDVKTPYDWSSDGKYIAYTVIDKVTKTDVWILPLFGDRKPIKFLASEFDEDVPIISPNMHWLAYRSNESGNYELYVRPFLGQDGLPGIHETRKWQVSGTGISPQSAQHWSRDGKRLIFMSADNKLMSAEIAENGSSLMVGTVRQVVEFKTSSPRYFIDVTPDGRQFVLAVPVSAQSSPPLTVIVNWDGGLRKK